MPQIKPLPIEDLLLDLSNYRTPPQKSEEKSLHALVSLDPDYFWALTASLLDDGWHGTENVIVLQDKGKNTVKEGNRRIGALKLALGKIKPATFDIPTAIATKMASVTPAWKTENSSIPCNIFTLAEKGKADRLVALTHGVGEKAGRLKWNSVARARHNRDENGAAEPALDVLEQYIKTGKNIDETQKEKWGVEYALTVLEEALQRIAARIGVADMKAAAAEYPKNAKYRTAFENVLHDIGTATLKFPNLRSALEDALADRGFPAPPPPPTPPTPPSTPPNSSGGNGGTSAGGSGGGGSGTKKPSGPTAYPINDPRSVIQALKKFSPRGNGREKVVLLLNEARSLKLDKQPHAFCFLLRSMFEISAKCFCDDHKPSATAPKAVKASGEDRQLVDVLRDITTFLVAQDASQKKVLHGATAELAKPDGFLSVTSMNQLVHNKKFSVNETHIATLFHNIFPLLEAMNR